MRSRSEIIFRAEETDRKSLATGCCIKSNRIQSRSISRSIWLMSSSVDSTFFSNSASPFSIPFTEQEIASSHIAPI